MSYFVFLRKNVDWFQTFMYQIKIYNSHIWIILNFKYLNYIELFCFKQCLIDCKIIIQCYPNLSTTNYFQIKNMGYSLFIFCYKKKRRLILVSYFPLSIVPSFRNNSIFHFLSNSFLFFFVQSQLNILSSGLR